MLVFASFCSLSIDYVSENYKLLSDKSVFFFKQPFMFEQVRESHTGFQKLNLVMVSFETFRASFCSEFRLYLQVELRVL